MIFTIIEEIYCILNVALLAVFIMVLPAMEEGG